MRMKTLLYKEASEIASMRDELIPKLLELEEKHDRKLKEVPLNPN
jgi:hypothetical protein